ncbi:Arc family DNA-binding protein [Sinorhizobium meliloti]|uniref:Arc family DNA-binding protein n=1 Tax=Rhizobium meliloti TaxID=382 RepID=UPI00299DB735|nr:Arc family DNA-binding protein [Sinorhizobium meliloti]MDW9997109.1 Arc family DNA-binding protein [Sinorhizobium meliloti]
MSNKRTGRGSDQYILRFPEGMRDEIKAAADRSGRSMNAEIIHRLEASIFGVQRTSSLDEIATAALKKIVGTPHVGYGKADRLNELYLELKKQEAAGISRLIDLANEIVGEASDDDFISGSEILPMKNIVEATDRKKS